VTSDTFPGWLRAGRAPSKLFFALIWAAALALGTQAIQSLQVPGLADPRAVPVLNVVLAAGLLAATLLRRPHLDETKFPKASAAVVRFYKAWRGFWAAALASALVALAARFLPSGAWAEPAAHALAAVRAFFAFLGFFALYLPFSKDPPARRPVLIGAILVLALLLDLVYLKKAPPALAFAPWLLSTLQSVSIALLVSRLASKLIEPPPLLLALAAAYALPLPAAAWAVPVSVLLASFFFLAFQWPVQSGVLLYALNRLHGLKNLVPGERKDFVGWMGWPLPPANSPSGVALCLRVVTSAPMNAPLWFHLRIRNNTGKPLSLGLWSLNESALRMDMGDQKGLVLAVRNASLMKGIPNTVSIEIGDWTEIRVPYAAWEVPASLLSASLAQNQAKSFKFVGSLTLLSASMMRPEKEEVALSNPADVEVVRS
jgi:hypothetical protein